MKNHFEGATPEALAKALLRPTKKITKTPRKRKHLWPRRTKVATATASK